jgi:hypothetical protein
MAALLPLGLGACRTPGESRAYLYAPGLGQTVREINPRDGAELGGVPAYVEAHEQVLGLAYDPFTDHLFIRLFPGNRVRVIDRPAAAIKRHFTIPSLPPIGGRDFAVRGRDRHFFFTDPNSPALFETDLNGQLEKHLPLAGLSAPAWGVAYDPRTDELLVLPTERGTRVLRYAASDASPRGEIQLETSVRGDCLAYDGDARQLYASLADGSAIGVFDTKGRLLRRLPRPDPTREVFFDLGPRSLVRLF